MSEISWSNDLQTGVEHFDDQHKILIDKINVLVDGIEAKNVGVNIKNFEDLASFVVQHFQEEEEFMAQIGYPGLSTHKVIHADLLKKVAEFKVDIENNCLEKTKFVQFLKFWLVSHIKGIDAKYGEFSNKQSA